MGDTTAQQMLRMWPNPQFEDATLPRYCFEFDTVISPQDARNFFEAFYLLGNNAQYASNGRSHPFVNGSVALDEEIKQQFVDRTLEPLELLLAGRGWHPQALLTRARLAVEGKSYKELCLNVERKGVYISPPPAENFNGFLRDTHVNVKYGLCLPNVQCTMLIKENLESRGMNERGKHELELLIETYDVRYARR